MFETPLFTEDVEYSMAEDVEYWVLQVLLVHKHKINMNRNITIQQYNA